MWDRRLTGSAARPYRFLRWQLLHCRSRSILVFNNPASADPEGLDPNYRANYSDAFNVTFQRQLHKGTVLEVGYIGRRIRNEFEPIELNAVPYMMTLGGQQFAQAYKNAVLQYCGGVTGLGGGGCAANAGAVTPQPFFEAALKGTGYCNGFDLHGCSGRERRR